MYQVKDAMSSRVVSIPPDTTAEQAIDVLLTHNVSGAPVIDYDERLWGIVTQFQLLEVMYDPKVKNSPVKAIMTKDVITLEEDDLLGTAANIFITHRIRRIPVVRGGKVVGVISRCDLLRYFRETNEEIVDFFAKLRGARSTLTEMMLVSGNPL